MQSKYHGLGPLQNTTYRLPHAVQQWIADTADRNDMSRAEVLVRLVQSQPGFVTPPELSAPADPPRGKPRGRRTKYPGLGPGRVLSARVPFTLLDKLDRIARSLGLTRTEALVLILLNRPEPPTP